MHKEIRISFWFCLLLLFEVLQGLATQVVPLSIDEMAGKARVVVHGTVVSKQVQRDSEGRIYTQIELQVTDTWKGAVQASPFVLVQAGGTLGEEVSWVDGQEEFAIGEEVVVFATENQRGQGVVLGLSQGKFKVRQEKGEKSVGNPFHGTGKDASDGPISISELKRRVQGGRP
jgi:hypothetical protein